jgi:hypothetical protein
MQAMSAPITLNAAVQYVTESQSVGNCVAYRLFTLH